MAEERTWLRICHKGSKTQGMKYESRETILSHEFTQMGTNCGLRVPDSRCLFSAAKTEKNEVVANCDLKRGRRRHALQTLVELRKMSPEFRKAVRYLFAGKSR